MTQFKLKCFFSETTTLSLRESTGESDESAEATVSAFWFSNDIHLSDIFFKVEIAELESWLKIKIENRLKTTSSKNLRQKQNSKHLQISRILLNIDPKRSEYRYKYPDICVWA